MKVHERIREIREKRKFSQDYMASKLEISQNTYSRMELGLQKLQVDKLMQIAELLEVSWNDLLDPDGQQVFNIKNNQTVNGNVTNNGVTSEERELFGKLVNEKDLRIEELLEEIKFLKGLVKK